METQGRATASDLTPEEQAYALGYLAKTRDALVEATRGLNGAQSTFKPAANEWCAVEILEHVAIVTGRVKEILAGLEQGPAVPPDYDPKALDRQIVMAAASRAAKVEAPPPVLPGGHCTLAKALEQFVTNHESMCAAFRAASRLRQHTRRHPFLGPLDGYQWTIVTAAHNSRHTKQILELKAHPEFPSG